MSEPMAGDHRERLQNALLAIRKLQARNAELEQTRMEPIAVIGLACRFPGGADSPEAFWRLLRDGVDAISEIPAARFDIEAYFDADPAIPGRTYSRWGGFVDDVDRFDPHFFGISPREAVALDPQHRLLLEVGWAALERAGIAPASLSGSRTGVFIGITGSDYGQLSRASGTHGASPYSATGSTPAFASGRLSYALGLQGPSVAVDTACSSSLAAVHLACQSLRSGDCGMALAGGVSLMLTPEMWIATSQNRMLSPSGRCRTFDAGADGFVRGEGCGVVVLKRLSAALQDGDSVLAVIRGSAMNQDGATSGITVPNKLAQEAAIREALAAAGVHPHEVGYVEAHGTGTSLGDPIEMRALAEVLSTGRSSADPVLIGSVKTNIGHLEAASGIAGLIKTILMLRHEEIAPSLHFREPSPLIPWDEIAAVVPTAPVPWTAGERRRVAGVSSFGASGTNIHVVVEEPPLQPAPAASPERPVHLLPLSARTDGELRVLATCYRDHLEDTRERLSDICHTAAVGRTHFAQRAALIGSDDELVGRLDALIAGRSAPGLVTGGARAGAQPKIAFLFTGQGSQYVNMGRQLWETEPSFRATLERCDEILRPHLEQPLVSVLYPAVGADAEAQALLDRTMYTQPALFSVEYALAQLWLSWGVTPHALLGHSVGEYVAACVAGVFSLEDGLRLIATRARLMQALPTGGAMVAVRAAPALVERAISAFPNVALAAVNGPESVVVSGAAADLERIVAGLRTQGIDCRALAVSHAFHSPLLDPMLPALEAEAARIPLQAPGHRLVSNLTGELAGAEVASPGYWRRHAREAVRFARGVETLTALGCDAFLEIGPSPVLLGMGQACAREGSALWLPSLRRGRSDAAEMLGSLGRLYTAGAPVDWRAFDDGRGRKRVWLPTYPFAGDRYWLEPAAAAPALPRSADVHPLLGAPLRIAGDQRIWESQLSAGKPEYLADHCVRGAVILPAAAYIEMALAAGSDVLGGAGVAEVRDVSLHEPLVLPAAGAVVVQVVCTPAGSNEVGFQVFSLADEGGSQRWRLHASGSTARLASDGAAPLASDGTSARNVPLQAPSGSLLRELSAQDHYAAMAARGIVFGETFRGVLALRQGAGEAVAEARLPDALGARARDYRIHPVLLDACLQAAGAALSAPASATYLPFGIARLCLHHELSGQVRVHATLRPAPPRSATLTADLTVCDGDGRLLLEIEGLALRHVPPDTQVDARGDASVEDLLYEVVWQSQDEGPREPPPLDTIQHGVRPLPPLDTVLEPVRHQAAGLEASADAAVLRALRPELDRLCGAYAARALIQLGWEPEPGAALNVAGLAALGVASRHERLLGRMLQMLAEDGVLEPASGGGWRVVRRPADTPPESLLAELQARFPGAAPDLDILARCAAALPDVLRGRQDPLELLFPDGSLTDAARLYHDSPFTREHNRLAAAAVAAAAAAAARTLAGAHRLRVLEVGGGTGGTTACVLPQLPAGQTSYTFTDVSPLFVDRAGLRFGTYDGFAGGTLDIGRAPAEQGFAAGSYDVIIAANVLHATPDLRQTLRHVRELLAPGGTVVLLEGVMRNRFADLTVGLTDGWWCFTDTPLRSYALIGSDLWLELLRETGLDARAVGGAGAFADQTVLVARAPGGTGGTADATAPAAVHAQMSAAETLPVGAEFATWLLLSDATGVGDELITVLRARGERCVVADAGEPASLRHLVRQLTEPGAAPLRGVVHLRALDGSCQPAGREPDGRTLTADALDAAQHRVTGAALDLVQALAAAGASPRLWLVTRGAESVLPGEPVEAQHATLTGLGKAISLEHPELRCVHVDLDAAGGESEAAALYAELQRSGAEDRVALRDGARYVARLQRRRPTPQAPTTPADGRTFQLVCREAGMLDGLALAPLERRGPAPGEVEVEVLATGLAFRDVLIALGQYPDAAAPLGGEFAGVVQRVGDDVSDLAVGDVVLGVAHGAFRSHLTTRRQLVARKPAALSVAEAAAIPSSFATAHYALHHLAGLAAGERVLIHGGAGGVGMAAIQLALRAGAEVFATAGTPARRSLLTSLGVSHALDSRSLDFADHVLAATNGEGVDVVLNSLADDFIPRSFDALAANGRFIELGKRGIWDPAQAAAVRPAAKYFVVDLAAAATQDPGLIKTLLAEVLAGFADGSLRPLPVKPFPIEAASEAFRYMAQARHVGRIVVMNPARPDVRADASYLITGGLGGVGLRVARWLVGRGARHLILVGRTPPSASARETLAELEALDARILTVQADVSSESDMDELFDMIERSQPPLRGVFHGALMLDDGVLTQQDWRRFQTVFAPRVRGAWLLHQRTASLPLDFFVMMSAAGSLVGSPGQANYTAANTFLDALAAYRCARGLPGLSVQWGVWEGVGHAAARRFAERGRQRGIGGMTPDQALAALDIVMRHPWSGSQVAVMKVSWPEFLASLALPVPPFLAAFAAESRHVDERGAEPAAPPVPRQGATLRLALETAPQSRRSSMLAAHVRTQVCTVLSLDPAHALDPHQPLQELGLDSLMAIELRTLLAAGLELPRRLPATLAFDYPTPDAIARFLECEIFGAPAASADAGVAVPMNAAAGAAMEQLSDAEAESLLLAELELMRGSSNESS